MILVISSSLARDSNSRLLAREAVAVLEREGQPVRLLDLRDHPLPPCDGESAYAHPQVPLVTRLVAEADALIVATPIYNYDGTAALKNLIELTGRAWENKPVGFLCAAGGRSSYMSIMSLANSLMLDFRCVIIPRFIYATSEAFADGQLVDPEQQRRIAELARSAVRFASLAGTAS